MSVARTLDKVEVAIQKLGILVKNASQGCIAFAVFESEHQREILREKMQSTIGSDWNIHVINMGEELKNLPEFLAVTPPPDNSVIFVYGLDTILDSALGYLNYQRESLLSITNPIVFWVKSKTLDLIANNAMDFWAWRSGVFFFKEEKPPAAIGFARRPQHPIPIKMMGELSEGIRQVLGDLEDIDDHRSRVVEQLRKLPKGIPSRMRRTKTKPESIKAEPVEKETSLQNTLDELSEKEARLRVSLSNLYLGIGSTSQARIALDQAIEIYRQNYSIVENSYFAELLERLGIIYSELGLWKESISTLQESLGIKKSLLRRGLIKEDGLTPCLNAIGNCFELQGEWRQAIKWLKESSVILKSLADPAPLCRIQSKIGSAYLRAGDLQKAERFYKKALLTAKRISDDGLIGEIRNNLGVVCARKGDYTKAISHMNIALQAKRQFGKNLVAEEQTLRNLAIMHRAIGEMQIASQYEAESTEIAQLVNDRNGEVQLMRKMREKDPLAERTIMQLCSLVAHNVANRFGLQTDDEIDDVVQEVLIRVWRHSRSFSPRVGSLRAWVTKITRNVIFESMRKRDRTINLELDQYDTLSPTNVDMEIYLPHEPDPIDNFLEIEATEELRAAIGKMSQRESQVLLMFLDGFSTNEIAKSLHCSLQTANITLTRAKKRAATIVFHESAKSTKNNKKLTSG